MGESTSTLRVVRAGPDDAGAVCGLAVRSLADPWTAASLREELARDDARGWVAIARDGAAGEAAVGYLLLRLGVDAGEILSLAVDPAHRRRGVGRALVARALEAAGGAGRPRVDLELRASNAGALALYRGLGFVVVGGRPRYYRDGEDAVLMTRPADRQETR